MFLKNRNISSKIKRSKVTEYAALMFLKAYCDWSGFPYFGVGVDQGFFERGFICIKVCVFFSDFILFF